MPEDAKNEKNNEAAIKQPNIISISKEVLVQIYNALYSIEVKGESVKSIAFIEQTLENLFKTQGVN
jgi:hypothetical protein